MDPADFKAMAEAAYEVLHGHLGGAEGIVEMQEVNWVPGVKQVISSDPYTTVKFVDGTESTVKANVEMGDKYDLDTGIVQAIFKRLYGEVDKDTGRVKEGVGMKIAELRKLVYDPKVESQRMAEENAKRRERNLAEQERIKAEAEERRKNRRPNIYTLVRELTEKVEKLQETIERRG